MCHLTRQETMTVTVSAVLMTVSVVVVVLVMMMMMRGQSAMFLMITDDVVTRLAGCWWCSQLNMQSPVCLLIILNITAPERRGGGETHLDLLDNTNHQTVD